MRNHNRRAHGRSLFLHARLGIAPELTAISLVSCSATSIVQPPAPARASRPSTHASLTQFLGAAVSGDGDDDPQLDGTLNRSVVFDGHTLSL